jgi:hypothetical protein
MKMTAAALALLCAGSVFAGKPVPPTPAPTPLVVVDSTGKVLGRFGDFSSIGAKVFMTVDGALTTVVVEKADHSDDYTHLYFTQGGYLFFTGVDCSGTAYVQAGQINTYGVKPSVLIADAAGHFYLYFVLGGKAPLRMQSYYTKGVCYADGGSYDVFPVSAPIDLTLQYTQPFTIQ